MSYLKNLKLKTTVFFVYYIKLNEKLISRNQAYTNA